MKYYRDNGAIGALLDEYGKAIKELQAILTGLTENQLTAIVDAKTKDPDCKSIQTVLRHVIRAGYYYTTEIKLHQGEQVDFHKDRTFNKVEQYIIELDNMFKYSEELFKDYPNLNLEEKKANKKILMRWGQLYNVEQLFEHAIVHILRHRRQIERFLIIQSS